MAFWRLLGLILALRSILHGLDFGVLGSAGGYRLCYLCTTGLAKSTRRDSSGSTVLGVPGSAALCPGEVRRDNPSLHHGWLGRQTTQPQRNRVNYKVWRKDPETTPRSPAPSRRREAPSVAAAAAAAAIVVAAAVAKILLCSCLLGTGQPCSRDCNGRF